MKFQECTDFCPYMEIDMRYDKANNDFIYHRFTRNMWCNVNKEERRKYMKNAYRVLLTRSRQGMIIYVPEGNKYDPTTAPELYDGTYEYLRNIGIEECKSHGKAEISNRKLKPRFLKRKRGIEFGGFIL